MERAVVTVVRDTPKNTPLVIELLCYEGSNNGVLRRD